jgi:RNA polymerase sigma factor (sigma-70 family)
LSLQGKISVLEEVVLNPHKHLIEGTLSGDHKCFKKLYGLYARAMYNTAFRIVNDKAEAEDILQESFISAYHNLRSFRFESTFGAWLKRIVVNKSLTVLQKRKIEFDSLDDQDILHVKENEIQSDNAFPCTVQQVVNAIEKLPDGYRTILSLYLLEGYDHVEISQILDISESTSKSQYSRARQKLLQILNKTL